MAFQVQIPINEKLFLRDPERTALGRNIIEHSIILMHKQGFEMFTFKKLAIEVGTTEAGVYRYFENKHRLLLYLASWYWGWLQFRLSFTVNNIDDPIIKLKKIIGLLAAKIEDDVSTSHVNEKFLHEIIIAEGSKSYLTKQVAEDNKERFFKPYKDLCGFVADIITKINPGFKYPRSLASTIIEMAHFQVFFMHHLPSLTDFGKSKDEKKVVAFLEELVFNTLRK